MMKNLIIYLTYHFPPGMGVGGKRIERLIRILKEYGYDYRVITVDQKLAEGKLEKNEEIKYDSSKISYLDINKTWLSIFDKSYGWYKNAIKSTISVLDSEFRNRKNVNRIIIFSSQPPHITHYVANKIKNVYGDKVFWIADFRDPWKEKYWSIERASKIVHDFMQKKVLNNADLIVSTTHEIVSTFKHYNKNNYYILPNSIDSNIFNNIRPNKRRNGIIVSHFGDLDYEWRNPKYFLKTISQIIHENQDEKYNNIQIHFWGRHGSWGGKGIKDYTLEYGLEGKVYIHDYVKHTIALTEILSSDLLLLFANKQMAQIPSKVYEYLYAKKRILAFCEKDSATAKLLSKFPYSKILNSYNVAAMQKDIENTLAEIIENKPIEIKPGQERTLTTEVVVDEFIKFLNKRLS